MFQLCIWNWLLYYENYITYFFCFLPQQIYIGPAMSTVYRFQICRLTIFILIAHFEFHLQYFRNNFDNSYVYIKNAKRLFFLTSSSRQNASISQLHKNYRRVHFADEKKTLEKKTFWVFCWPWLVLLIIIIIIWF